MRDTFTLTQCAEGGDERMDDLINWNGMLSEIRVILRELETGKENADFAEGAVMGIVQRYISYSKRKVKVL